MSHERLLHWEMLELHCPRKFLDDLGEQSLAGCHLKMTTQDPIAPCRAGCCPAIREFVREHECSAEYASPEHTFSFSYQDTEGDG